MSTRVRPEHRLNWHNGQPLGRADLADWAAFEPELLALHVRAGHATWGIAEGLDVARTADLRAVAVASGAGFTCTGHRLLLERETFTAPPGAAADTFVLSLRAAPPAARECHPTPPCPDPFRPPAARTSAASLAWRTVRAGPAPARCGPPPDELVLARIRRGADGRLDPPDLAVRRVAAPAVRPRIAHASIAGDAVDWFVAGPVSIAGVIAADAGFDRPPHFFPAIHGALLPAGVLGPWAHVGWASASAFELRLGFGAASGTEAQAIVQQVLPRLRQTTVSWIAVERPGGCGSVVVALPGLQPVNILPNLGLGGGP